MMGSRVILDIHDVLPGLYAGKFDRAPQSVVFRYLLTLERWSCNFADHVIVANDLWREKLVRRSVTSARCTTLLNYPDLRIFRPLPVDSKPLEGKFVILYAGSLNLHQGLDIAVKAFARARGQMPAAELHIYGEGPARERLCQLIDECEVRGLVQLHTPLPLDEIAHVMAAASLGV